MSKNKRILILSDMHIPYEHPDTYAFLKALKKKYNPDKVVCIGDEIDHSAMSFHDSDPDLFSAGDELQASIRKLTKLYKLFPEVDVVDSNHGSMAYRKGKHHGIPRKYLRDYNEVLDAPDTWQWHDEIILNTPQGPVMFRHQFKASPLICAQQLGMSIVQGHYHSVHAIEYVSSPTKLMYALTVGCLIDKKSLAFAYNKIDNKRPIISVGMIIDGVPRLMPMFLDKEGRWTKIVP
jgi:hypothetical protein